MLFLFAHITVNAVGDVMLGSITPRRRVPPDSGRVFVENVKDYLSGAHVVFGNLEGTFMTTITPLTTDGGPTGSPAAYLTVSG